MGPCGIIVLKKSQIYEQYQPSINNSKKYITRFGALQSAIRIGRVCFNSRHDDYHKFKFLSVVLGGYFGSRLIRSKKKKNKILNGIFMLPSPSSSNLDSFFIVHFSISLENAKWPKNA